MELREYCTYRNDRVNSDELNTHNYISTENLLPNKGGITEATSIPTGNVVRYDKGNILISNIRPYFKKIWLADKSGGCSADVLCIQSNDKVTSKFLYYLLSQQSFFDYVMAGAKGCKMPRGDKSHIMEWSVNIPDIDEQKRIADFLSSLDDKIELNRQINDNLEQQAQALFKSWFVDFEPFKDGEFVDSELGMIPKGWRVGNIFDIANIFDSQRKPLSSGQREKMDKIYPYYGATSCMDYVDNYIFDGIYTLIGEDGSVVRDNGLPFVQYVWGKFWVNNHAHILQGKNGFSTEMIYIFGNYILLYSNFYKKLSPKDFSYGTFFVNFVIPMDLGSSVK